MVEKIRSNWKRLLKWVGIGLIYALPIVVVQGAFDAFLKIDGVPGESTDAKHAQWVEILSFSHGVSQPSSAARSAGGAASAERTDHKDFTIVKTLDKASPKLALYACNGKHLPYVTLQLCRATGDKTMYMEYKLSDVIVSSVMPAGSANGGETLPLEEVTFNYGKIEWKYIPTDNTGKPAGEVKAYWDRMSNKGG